MRDLFWGFVLIALGGLFLLDNMGVVDFGDAISTYWPVLLIVWGIAVLLKKKEPPEMRVSGEATHTVSDELFHESSVFGDLRVDVGSQNFKGGSVSTVFGDCDIDLTRSSIADGEHWLRISGVFGDVRVAMPKDVAVSVSGNVLFGDVRLMDQTRGGFSPDLRFVSPGYDSAVKKFRIVVTQVFGDITVSR